MDECGIKAMIKGFVEEKFLDLKCPDNDVTLKEIKQLFYQCVDLGRKIERTRIGQEKAQEAYKRFEAQQGAKLYWRRAFSCLTAEGDYADKDAYLITKDQRFLIKIPKGQSEARCLDIHELNKLPNEEEII